MRFRLDERYYEWFGSLRHWMEGDVIDEKPCATGVAYLVLLDEPRLSSSGSPTTAIWMRDSWGTLVEEAA